jgi:hypothetical protein
MVISHTQAKFFLNEGKLADTVSDHATTHGQSLSVSAIQLPTAMHYLLTDKPAK